MSFQNSLKFSLVVFVLMCLIMALTKIDSYSWAEPTTDVEYRLRGIWTTMGWVIAIGAPVVTFLCLILLWWLKKAISKLMGYWNK